MGRQPCCEKIGLKKGPWTVEEDHKLMSFILSNGIHCWRMVPKLAGLLRCGKSCRLRWINYLRPDLKRGALSESEEDQIIQLHARLGNKWSKIAAHFPGRTDNEIKNHWNTRIKKRLKLLGLDPVTHMPIHQNHTTDEDNTVDTIPHPASSKQENETSDANSGVDLPTRAEEKEREVDLIFAESTVLLDDYDETLGAFDVGLWLSQENSIPKVCSPPVSVEDSLNPSADESSSSFPEESLQQWINGVDSLLSWDGFNQLQEELFFMDHSNEHT